jgi:hypothetical protein
MREEACGIRLTGKRGKEKERSGGMPFRELQDHRKKGKIR